MDAGWAAIIGSLVGAAITLLGLIVQGRRDRERQEAEHRWADEIDKAARVRDFDLARMDETRSQIVGTLDGIEAIINGDIAGAKRLLATARGALLANAVLIGDVEAAAAFVNSISAVLERYPSGPFRQVIASIKGPWTAEDRAALGNARLLVVIALAGQQARAVGGEPLQLISSDDFNRLVDADRMSRLEARFQ